MTSKVFADLNRGHIPYQDWMAFAKQLGAKVFKTVDGVEVARRDDGAYVGKWNHNTYLGWVRSAPEIVAAPNDER